ncbi:hypothetical protein E1B28_005378 [Marasmius oreades]|uniref:Short-chain dehydrogenase/reductase SDR n=1 Tax=Marasmius oreades TaxID=181124 RepID=A0A9P7UUQ7_9AGAR|nr:uncharacterized protein E1B28_005378 [Marasmius oreades]KAG7094550.1 hypothetical protein E1B28_005378 [Marasmius oreades]
MTTKAALRPLLVVAGVGGGSGTGAASAKLFSKSGYDVALIARNAGSLQKLSDEINSNPKLTGKATAFEARSYSHQDMKNVFNEIWSHYDPKQTVFRAAIYNIGYPIFKPFLETTPEEFRASLEGNVEAAYAFSREVIPKLLENQENEEFEIDGKTIVGGKGSLIFTGATAALRGGKQTSAFSTAKGGSRNLNQSLAKEFWPQGVHVAHAIIDGRIQGEHSKSGLDPESIAQAYLNLARQERTVWTWELDLRPAEENW